MPEWSLFYHIIWTTKNREPIILPGFQGRLFAVIAQKASSLGGIVHAIGGVADHLHLAVSVPPRISLAGFIGQVKGSSAHFVNHEIQPGFHFAWQAGYSVISLHEAQLKRVGSIYYTNQNIMVNIPRMSGLNELIAISACEARQGLAGKPDASASGENAEG